MPWPLGASAHLVLQPSCHCALRSRSLDEEAGGARLQHHSSGPREVDVSGKPEKVHIGLRSPAHGGAQVPHERIDIRTGNPGQVHESLQLRHHSSLLLLRIHGREDSHPPLPVLLEPVGKKELKVQLGHRVAMLPFRGPHPHVDVALATDPSLRMIREEDDPKPVVRRPLHDLTDFGGASLVVGQTKKDDVGPKKRPPEGTHTSQDSVGVAWSLDHRPIGEHLLVPEMGGGRSQVRTEGGCLLAGGHSHDVKGAAGPRSRVARLTAHSAMATNMPLRTSP